MKPIRVLFLEDQMADVELMLYELHRADLEPEWRRAETEAEYLACLEDSPDIILADYTLPQFDGLRAIQLLRQKGLDIPLIIVTGSISEEVAVACIKQGAADYLLKDRLTRLGTAVVQALEQRRLRREKWRAEEALRKSERRFRSLIENISDLLVALRPDGAIHYASPSCERLLGYAPEALTGKNLLDLVHPDDRPAVWERVLRLAPPDVVLGPVEVRLCGRDDTWHTLETTGRNLLDDPAIGGIILSLRDISDRKMLEAQLRQVQKMEAIGRIAGSIAHDFNNFLIAILGYSELLLGHPEYPDEFRQDVEAIKQAAQRAAGLANQLLTFSRKQISRPQHIRLDEVVSEMEQMLSKLLGPTIQVTLLSDAEPNPVYADPGQIEQVIINLALNARDAMPQGGTLTVETANLFLDEAYSRRHLDVRPGHYVLLAVSDTGIGMTEEVRARIFEPFFTTKEKGKGTGLGLSTVYGIIHQSGGHIWVYSEPGQGSTFKVYLPYEEPVRVAEEPLLQEEEVRRGEETLLLVEDDEVAREIGRRVLLQYGYTVLVAEHPEEALAISRRHEGPIHLMVTDVIMPGMNGRELAERLSGERPEMKVLYISGYTDQAVVRHGILEAGHPFLQKPFTPALLARRVREVLNGP